MMCSVRSERIDRAPTEPSKQTQRIYIYIKLINIKQFCTLYIYRQILRTAIVLCIKKPLKYFYLVCGTGRFNQIGCATQSHLQEKDPFQQHCRESRSQILEFPKIINSHDDEFRRVIASASHVCDAHFLRPAQYQTNHLFIKTNNLFVSLESMRQSRLYLCAK